MILQYYIARRSNEQWIKDQRLGYQPNLWSQQQQWGSFEAFFIVGTWVPYGSYGALQLMPCTSASYASHAARWLQVTMGESLFHERYIMSIKLLKFQNLWLYRENVVKLSARRCARAALRLLQQCWLRSHTPNTHITLPHTCLGPSLTDFHKIPHHPTHTCTHRGVSSRTPTKITFLITVHRLHDHPYAPHHTPEYENDLSQI